MKARYTYPLLFLLPSAMLALLAAFVVAGVGAGVFWIFMYGDSPWPRSAERILMGLAIAASVGTLAALIARAYAFGKRREADGGLCRRHVAIATVTSILIPALALLHQWGVGNVGL